MAVQIDGTYRMSTLVPILKRLVQEVGSSNGSVGIGLVSMIGFEDTAKLLRVSGLASSLLCIRCSRELARTCPGIWVFNVSFPYFLCLASVHP